MSDARRVGATAAASALRAGVLLKLAALFVTAAALVVIAALVLSIWWAANAGAGAAGCPESGGGIVHIGKGAAPPELVPLFESAAARYRLGARGPATLAALTKVESGFGQNMGPSSAGAVGWTQFMPATWRQYGVDADGDGRRDPFTAADAIHSSARYLRASGAPADWQRALFAYNHADWYVTKVLREAEAFTRAGPLEPRVAQPAACVPAPSVFASAGADRIVGGGRIVAIPGSPGESIDVRILEDVLALQRRYRFTITDGYAPTGHDADGEHPLGLGLDLVPGPRGSWEDIDALARWAEPRPNAPRPPFRWVGYDGDANHGRGHHLHLSWDHSPTPQRRPPASWVLVLPKDRDEGD